MSNKSIEEMEADVRAAFDWPKLIRQLDQLREFKERFWEKPDPADLSGANGRMVFSVACDVLKVLMDRKELEAAYDKTLPESASQKAKLLQITHRLMLVSGIFDGVELAQQYDDDGEPVALARTTLSSLWQEVSAIRAGDQPHVLAGPPSTKGRPTNAYRLAFEQLRALAWEKELRANGWSTADAQNAVAGAYGETWTTIYGWRRQVKRELGEQLVDQELENAGRVWSSDGWQTDDTRLGMLSYSGKKYRDELSRRVVLVPNKKT